VENKKARRVRIVLVKCELAAGDEIHAVLPDTLVEFEAAYARGEVKRLVDATVDQCPSDLAG